VFAEKLDNQSKESVFDKERLERINEIIKYLEAEKITSI